MAQTYFVRDNLVVRLTDSKTYEAGEKVQLSEAEYERHAHQVETEEQYLSRTQPSKTKKDKEAQS